MLKPVLQLVYTCLMLVQGVILAKIILMAIKANMTTRFATFVNKYSDIVVQPFNGIVSSSFSINGVQIPWLLPVSLLMYLVAASIVSQILKAFSHSD